MFLFKYQINTTKKLTNEELEKHLSYDGEILIDPLNKPAFQMAKHMHELLKYK